MTPSSALVAASRINRSGTQIPSLSPLSTLRPWLTRTGSRGSRTTAWPNAASVGARMTPTNPASNQVSPPKSALAATAPNPMVSGSPTPEQPGWQRIVLS